MSESFFEEGPEGVKLFVRLTPKASADRIESITDDGAGRLRVKAMVRAVPEDGKANAAAIVLFAKRFGVSKSAVSLLSGATNRSKTLLIEGDANRLATIAAELESASKA